MVSRVNGVDFVDVLVVGDEALEVVGVVAVAKCSSELIRVMRKVTVLEYLAAIIIWMQLVTIPRSLTDTIGKQMFFIYINPLNRPEKKFIHKNLS